MSLAIAETLQSSPSGADVKAVAMIGREIAGRYRIRSKLGEGAMGAVYEAEQLSLKRAVAVKVLKPGLASSELLLRRFNAEAEAVAKLGHPNTVTIYDFGQDTDGSLFIAMELIEGRSLRSMIQHAAPFPIRRALAIASQIAASLADAHSQDIVHRDLKPDNVMLQERGRTRDIVRVLDFGIAKLRDEGRAPQMQMTQEGDMIGTPQYMAPEQIRAEVIDGRTDIYALGCILYEMVTGRLPHEAATVLSLVSKHLLDRPVPPSQRRPDLAVPPAIDELILGAMAKDPAARPATMELLGAHITSLLETMRPDATLQGVVGELPTMQQPSQPSVTTPSVTQPVVTQPVATQRSSRTALIVIVGLLVLAGGGVGVWAAMRGSSTTEVAKADPPAAHTKPEEPAATSAPGTLPSGAELITPPGFEVMSDAPAGKVIVDRAKSLMIGIGPIESASKDPQEVAKLWALQNNLRFERLTKITSHGEERWVGEFSSVGQLNAFKQLAISFLSKNYRIAVVISAPPALVEDRAFQQWLAEFLEHNVRLP